MPINKTAYTQLTEEDIAWLRDNTEPCLEQDSIIRALRFLDSLYKGGGDYKGFKFDHSNPANQP